MSYVATNWAWELDLPQTHKFLLVALADMADEDNSCFPGQKKLSTMTGMSVRTIARRLAELEEWGLITREERRRPDGYRSSDRFYLHPNISHAKLSHDKLSHDKSDISHMPLPGRAVITSKESPDNNYAISDDTVAPKATRVSMDFRISLSLLEWAKDKAPSVDLDYQTEAFIDYWKGIPGARGLKTDWDAAWRNWMRKNHLWNIKNGWKPVFEMRVVK